MEIDDIVLKMPAPFFDPKKEDERLDRLYDAVIDALPEDGIAIGTTLLMRRMGANQEQFASLAKWLRMLRLSGQVRHNVTQKTPHRSSFGKPSYVWHRKRELSNEERLAITKKVESED